MTPATFDDVNYFKAKDLWQDPYPYYEWLRQQGPVWREPHRGVVMITGLEEATAIYRDHERFSSCNTVSGPFPGLPVPEGAEDISDLIEAQRDTLPFSDQLPSFDPPRHSAHRGLLMRLITKKRLRENEEFMWRLADRQLDEFLPRGACDFPRDYASPFTLLVIADLLGVPEEDHASFLAEMQGTAAGAMTHKPLAFLYERFTRYIEDRRRQPRDDVMTQLATATFPDGSLPDVDDVMLIAGNLFAAGQETTARLLSTMLRYLGERPELQRQLREKRDLIPAFVEEAVRLESPIQGDFRLSRVPTTVGGVALPAGTTVMLLNGAANRDEREFEAPTELRLDRPNGRYHVGFGFGIHLCAGAPLARAEARVSLERIFERTGDITISEQAHGPLGQRRYEYTPIYMLRGLEHLHLEFTPAVTTLVDDPATASTSDERFREELRAWLVAHPPPPLDMPTTDEEADVLRAWHRTLHGDGWVGIHWPVEHGGRGAPPAQVAIYNQELARAGAPPLLGRAGVTLVGPTLMAHGTEEQCRAWIPRILNGDDVWCQLFSEPDAGSDLASLGTRAERRGDVYVLNGQKVWTSYAQHATWGITLVRTDPSASKTKGISMLAVPLTAPGVTIRPLRQITGASEFNEVFLDDVEVTVANRIGPEHDGWRVTSTTLANERGASFVWKEQVLHDLAIRALIGAARDRGRGDDPVARQRLARSWIDVELFRLHNARTLDRLGRGEELGPSTSLVKLLWAETSQRLYATAVDLLGLGALLAPDDDEAVDAGRWALGLLAAPGTSIMGGTSEIQRTIIGEHLLGLPREPR